MLTGRLIAWPNGETAPSQEREADDRSGGRLADGDVFADPHGFLQQRARFQRWAQRLPLQGRHVDGGSQGPWRIAGFASVGQRRSVDYRGVSRWAEPVGRRALDAV